MIKTNILSQTEKQKGAAMLISVIFFLFISLAVISGLVSPALREFRAGGMNWNSKQSYFLAESGSEDAAYRLIKSKTIGSNETLTLNGSSATTTITSGAGGTKVISSEGDVSNYNRKTSLSLAIGSGVAFHYGAQVGAGGASLSQSSQIVGNVFSAGPIVGLNFPHNTISGDAISSGSSGAIYGIYATGSIYAHTIGDPSESTKTDQDAYYQSITNTTVSGSGSCLANSHCHPGSTDQASVDLPISDDQIVQWEGYAAAGGVMDQSACDSFSANTCTISSPRTLGPIKIPFSLIIKNSAAILTVTGPIWITGNLSLQAGPTIKMDSGLGSTNVAIVVDDPANESTSSTINVGQSSVFQGSGSPGSFVFLISQNNSAENGGAVSAITLSQGASALVAYASHGLITLSQSVNVKEATAYKLGLTQSASVTYDTGLPNTVFQSGPSGAWVVKSWSETQ